jgi:hypothetical protein
MESDGDGEGSSVEEEEETRRQGILGENNAPPPAGTPSLICSSSFQFCLNGLVVEEAPAAMEVDAPPAPVVPPRKIKELPAMTAKTPMEIHLQRNSPSKRGALSGESSPSSSPPPAPKKKPIQKGPKKGIPPPQKGKSKAGPSSSKGGKQKV